MAADADQRRIALVDLDAFYASVEEVEDPSLRGKPLLVGGSPEGRGVVMAASYEARRYGCRSAMPMAQALRLCPEAVVLPGRRSLYHQYSERVMDILRRESPVVQPMSIDEAYVDLTGVSRDMAHAEALAHRMQGRIRVEAELPSSIGLASNRMVAKVACETGKPNGFVVIQPGGEAAFLAPLPVRKLPGVGPRSAERLNAAGFETLGQVAAATPATLTALLGPGGALLQRRAMGEDASPVSTEREAKSISAEETFSTDMDDRAAVLQETARLADRVAESLEGAGLLARTVTVKLRYADFTTLTRSQSRPTATADAEAIRALAVELVEAAWEQGRSVRLVGVGVSNMRPRQAEGQMALEAPAPHDA